MAYRDVPGRNWGCLTATAVAALALIVWLGRAAILSMGCEGATEAQCAANVGSFWTFAGVLCAVCLGLAWLINRLRR